MPPQHISSLLAKGSQRAIQGVETGRITKADTVVVLMGPTGSGKTSFINAAAGTGGGVGHSLETLTSDVNVVRARVPDEDIEIVLVDTPGFDNTYRSDYQTLEIISDWLEKTHPGGVLDGILYFHDITENRMDNISARNLVVFEKMCGPRWFRRFVLVSTMWDELENEEVGERREEELKTTFWKPIIDRGSMTARHTNNKESAWRILEYFLDVPRERLAATQLRGGPSKHRSCPTQSSPCGPAVDAPRIVAVMGPTGAGKSTFIKTATGADVGDGLTSDTQVVRAIKCRDPFQGRDFLLLDTPGFDDIYKSDGEILAEIARWLSKTYRDGVKLSGILYLHRITDNRMADSLIRNLRMFQELCGGDAFSNVIFVTTHWDACKRGGDSREQELRNNYWKLFLQGGSQMLRFENAKSSAWNIINALPSTQKPLKIQRELVDEQKLLSETSAGRPLFSWFGRLSQSLERYIGRLTNLSKTAPRNSENKQYERRLRAGITKAEADLREIENQRSRLSGRTLDLN